MVFSRTCYICIFVTLALYIAIITLDTKHVVFVAEQFYTFQNQSAQIAQPKLILDWTRFFQETFLDAWWKVILEKRKYIFTKFCRHNKNGVHI
jgi:hypothetical protein